MFRSVAITLALCLATATAQAALLSRAGGQAYYDDVLNITWMADANLAYTNSFGVTGIYTGPYTWAQGGMPWATANEWIAAMNASAYLGRSDWRLPKVIDTGASGCVANAYYGTDCGWNVNLSTGELAHLYYTLGNSAAFNTNGVFQPCGSNGPNFCLTHTGPFSNLKPDVYWSGTEYAPDTSNAWHHDFNDGGQAYASKDALWHVWAVRDGDIGVVPIPPAVWLFGSALVVMGWMRRKVAAPMGVLQRCCGAGTALEIRR
jgi:hypothetical protein